MVKTNQRGGQVAEAMLWIQISTFFVLPSRMCGRLKLCLFEKEVDRLGGDDVSG